MTMLRLDHLNKAFGSLIVTDDINLAIDAGERHVIIGPNGAGKTSLINQIGGQLQPTSGRIFVKDNDITGWSPSRVSRVGVARTFQRNNLFQNLSVIGNLRLALELHVGHPLDFWTPAGRNPDPARARQKHHDAGTSRRRTACASSAAFPMASSANSRSDWRLPVNLSFCLLDEPTSGMSPAETARMIGLIGTLPRNL